MDFVGRSVAVATANKKLRGKVAKVEEGRLHVAVDHDKIAVVSAEEIVDLQVLSEQPQGSRQSSAPGKQSKNGSSNKNAASKANTSSPRLSPGPSREEQQRPPPKQRSQQQQSKPRQPSQREQQPKQQSRQPKQQQPKQQQKGDQQQPGWDSAKEEFDFEASNRQFDKSAVFQSIAKATPSVPSGDRTVYRPDEMVTSRAPRNKKAENGSANGSTERPLKAGKSNASLPVASALQKVQVQSYMLGQGWSADALNEGAGRGVAAVCMRNLAGASRTGGAPSTVVILVGNHTSGARALAGGRILATRGEYVVVVVVDAASNQLESETPAFKASGGIIVSTQKGLFAALERAAPVSVVVDALQGLERTSLEDQIGSPEQLAASRWLVGWANNQRTPRVAIERASTHAELSLRATALVSFGWPLATEPTSKIGPALPSPQQFVVDLGIPRQVLSTLNLAQLYINFGNKFYIDVEV